MPLLQTLPRAHGAPGRALRAALTVSAALLLVTCSGDTPIGPGHPGIGTLRVAPQFDAYARLVPLALDKVRVIVVRPPSHVIADVTQDFSPNSSQIQIDVSVLLQGTSEDLYVTLQLLSGTTLLFEGTDTISVTAGGTTPPSSIPVVYEGPGSSLTSLSISPRDSTVPPNAVVQFGATAADDGGPVTSFYVNWSSSGGTINAAGSFTAPGVRDTIFIVAVSPNQVRDSTRVFISAAPSSMTKTSGDLQTGLASSRLPLPLEVQVNGTDGLPVPGVAVTFAATTGGGSVDSSVAHTDANGFARTGATLGATLGAQTFTASATGLTAVVFSANATSGIVWTGAVDANWHTAGNWSPAQVPGIADNVTIPVTATQPVVSTTANMNDLTIAAGATVTLATTFTFNVAGNLTANGNLLVSGGTPSIQLSGTGRTLSGQVANAAITGTIALAGTTTVSGNVTISGGTATLDIGIFALQVGGNFSTGSGGRLIMTTAGGQLNITGSGAFGGGSETGVLTAGTITIGGAFSQTGPATAFAPSGSHTTGFTGGAVTHTVSFQTPGAGATGSHFASLDMSGAGTVSLATDVNVDGLLTAASGTPTLGTNGTTHRLTAVSISVTGLTVNQATLAIGSGTIVAFSGVQFTNSPTTVAQLTVNHPGAATAFNFTNLSFATTPVGPNGFYMDVTDTDGLAPSLVINMVTPTPATPGAFVRTAGGAAVNWPSTQPIVTWDGSADNNWSNLNNWTPARVPTNADDVVIPPGTPNAPQLSTSCSAKSLTVNAGASLATAGVNCQVAGNVFADGAITGLGAIQIATTAQIRGTIAFLQLSGPVTAVGPLTVTGSLTVTGATGTFTVNGQVVTVNANLTVQSGALLVMTNVNDVVTVSGNASFSGGNEGTSLTAGTLTIGGNFNQATGTTGETFHPSGTHTTIFTSNTPTISFANPGDGIGFSDFQNLSWTGTGTLTLGSDVYVHGVTTSTSATTITVSSAFVGGRLFQIGIHTGSGSGIIFNNVRLALNQPAGGTLNLNNATFQGLVPAAIQLTVNHTGAGGPFTFNNLTFSVTPTGAGRYLSVTDVDGAPNGVLTLNITNSNPANGLALTTVLGGAIVNWPPIFPAATWTGATDADWFKGGNWSSGAVPTAATDVVIPSATPNSPVLGATGAVVKSLTVNSGAILSLTGFTLTTNGNLFADGSITSSTGGITMAAAGQLRGPVPGLLINAPVTAIGTVFVTGDLTISGAAASYTAGAVNTVVTGNLATQTGGTLTMNNANDVLSVLGSASFGGGDETGKLTQGILQVEGNFTQLGTATSFAAGGSHTTQLISSGQGPAPIINFGAPGSSRFQNLDVTAAKVLILQTSVNVLGQLTSVPGTPLDTLRATAPGPVLTVGGAIVQGLVMDRVPLVITGGGALTLFSRATFQNQSPTGIALAVTNTGIGGPFTFDQLTFTTTLTAGGLHIQANDADGATPNPFILNVTNSSPASGAGVSQANNGAQIIWPPAAPIAQWVGATNDWNTASNWSTNAVPGPTDSVVIAASTAAPVLTQPVVIGAVNIVSGGMTVGGQFLQVARTLTTAGTGTLTMNNVSDQVIVGGNAIFSGGSTNGLLTAGLLQINGNFTQLGTTSPLSFAASCNHTTELGFATPAVISFATPGTALSHFGSLAQGNFGTNFQLGSDVVIECALSGPDGFGGNINGTGNTKLSLRSLSSSGITLDGVQLIVNDPTGAGSGLNGVQFTNQPTNATQLTINHPGSLTQSYFLSGITWTPLSGGNTGFYLSANDVNSGTGGSLVVDVTSNDPGNGPLFQQVVNGASIHWPGQPIIWTGAAGNSQWTDGNNWQLFAPPSPSDSVIIPGVGSQPVLNADITVGAVNINGGNITMNGHIMNVARTFATTGIGTLTMTNPADQMLVQGNVIFDGGGGGALSAGTIAVAGNFTQAHTNSTASFTATGTHTLQFQGAGTQTVTFADSILSFARNLVITNVSTPGVRPASVVQSTGFLSLGPGAQVTATDLGINGTGFNVLGTVGIATGANLTVGRLYVGGTISSSGTYNPTSTIFTGVGQPANAILPYKNVYIDGSVNFDPGVFTIANDLVLTRPTSQLNMGGPVNVGGNLFIQGGNLQPNGQQLSVIGNLTTAGNGTLTMGNAIDNVTVGGSAIFGGGNSALALGTLQIGGDFNQLAGITPLSFAASCSHNTRFVSPNPTITFQTPGLAQSHFGTLLGTFGQAFSLGSAVTVQCTINGGDGFGGVFKGGGNTELTTQTLFSAGVTFDGVQLVMSDPTGNNGNLSNITFINQPNSAVQLTISHPGFPQGTPYSLNNITWTPLTTGAAGFYVSAVDADGPGAANLQVRIEGNNPGNGPTFTKTDGTATVLWVGAPIEWSGLSDNDSWIDPQNWVGGVVPTATDNAEIPAGTPFSPRVTGTQSIQNLTILPGATLAINDATLNVSGSVTSSGTITDPGGGVLVLNGTGQTVQGSIGIVSIQTGASYTLAGTTTAGNVDVAGVLNLGGFTMSVTGNFSTNTNGVLVMQNPTDQLIVTGDVTFGGGSTVGTLTQGNLSVGGNFFQTSGTSTASFAASSQHLVSLTGTAPHMVDLAGNGIGSVFASLLVSGSGALNAATNLQFTHDLVTSGGTINLNGHNFIVVGNFQTGGSGTLTMTNPADVLTVAGAAVFNGGSTAGLLTNGVLNIGASLNQLSGTSNLSFAPSGLHRTVAGTTGTVSFQSPGTAGAGSHFNALDVTGATGGLAFTTNAFVDSALIASVGAAGRTVSGNGLDSLTAKQWLVNGLTVSNLLMVLNEGTAALVPQTFDGVTFQGFTTGTTTTTLITVTAAGASLAPRPLQFNSTILQTNFGNNAGTYVRVSSSNGQGLHLIMNGSNDPTGGFSRSIATAPATIAYQ